MTLPTLTLTPQTPGIACSGGALRLLIRVQAPEPSQTAAVRLPLQLALVLDRSGSMQGAPLEEARRCAERIIERLTPRDRAAVIAFDNTVRTLVPLRPVDSAAPFREALRDLTPGGSTALHNGWLQGAHELAPFAERGALSRVVLLSDGQANVGEQDPARIGRQCAELADAGVTTTTIGLGDGFNEDLMVGMARQGCGQSYYGQNATDLVDAFAEELDLVEALHCQRLAVTLTPGTGVIVKVLSQDDARPGAPIRLSDLAHGAEAWLLVELHSGPKQPGIHALLSVSLTGVLRTGEALSLGPTVLELPAISDDDLARLPREALIENRALEVETAQDFLAFRRRLVRGDREGAERALEQARVRGRTHGWIAASVAEMEQLLAQDEGRASKEALYTAQRMQTRLAAPMEGAYEGDETQRAELPRFLRRKNSQGRG
jgi:Ca-activated chloride channel family protein